MARRSVCAGPAAGRPLPLKRMPARWWRTCSAPWPWARFGAQAGHDIAEPRQIDPGPIWRVCGRVCAQRHGAGTCRIQSRCAGLLRLRSCRSRWHLPGAAARGLESVLRADMGAGRASLPCIRAARGRAWGIASMSHRKRPTGASFGRAPVRRTDPPAGDRATNPNDPPRRPQISPKRPVFHRRINDPWLKPPAKSASRLAFLVSGH